MADPEGDEMNTMTWMRKTTMARVAVLSLGLGTLALGPVALLAQQTASDGSPVAQDQTQGAEAPMHGHHNPAERQEHMLKMLTKKLNLTPDQVSQVQTIQNDSMTQMQALRQDTATAPADRHAKMREIHETEQEKIRAVLNDQQKPKFDAMVARQKEHMHEHQGETEQPAPPPQQ